MNLARLVWCEIAHRKLNFALSLVSVVIAVAGAVGILTLLRGHEIQTAERVAAMDDEIRRITKDMGFNIYILPAAQNLSDFYADDFAAHTMPEEYVERLAQTRDVVTVNHLRPALIRKLTWPEQNRDIILMGVRGVVPFAHRKNKEEPLALPVPEGKVDVGHVLAKQLDLKPGSTLTLLDRPFEVHEILDPRGNKDDITLWIDLVAAQQMLGLEGEINMIQALECNCSSIDRLAEIEAEISRVLGGEVQVIELATTAIARAKARTQVESEGEATLARWQSRAGVLIPLVMGAATIWVGLLSLANVRQRRQEIGILRAIGLRWQQILMVFLSKAVLLGLLGAVLGYGFGFALAAWAEANPAGPESLPVPLSALFAPGVLVAVLLLTPVLSILASWLPALQAASQDPAPVLQES
jgi:putative ABC transport system permease protein